MFQGMSQRITTFCTDLIVRSGPQPLDDLTEQVRAAGLTTARKPETTVKSALNRSDGFVLLPDGRYDAVARMLDGAVLTHRVRAATAATGQQTLFAGHELALFDELLSAGPLPLVSGGEVRRSRGDVDGCSARRAGCQMFPPARWSRSASAAARWRSHRSGTRPRRWTGGRPGSERS
jgi:hypothetical protein